MCESKRQNTLRIFWRRRDIFVLKAHKTKSREERRYVRGCPTKKKANDARGSRKMTAFIHVYKGDHRPLHDACCTTNQPYPVEGKYTKTHNTHLSLEHFHLGSELSTFRFERCDLHGRPVQFCANFASFLGHFLVHFGVNFASE